MEFIRCELTALRTTRDQWRSRTVPARVTAHRPKGLMVPAARSARLRPRRGHRRSELRPNRVVHAGVEHPKELLHGRLVSEWVQRLDPAAGEEQLLAARAHHFRRWTSPRDAHPPGRAGYLRWRAEAARRQAEEVGELLRRHGYDEATVERVGAIIRKEGRTRDPAVQTHEDALCLVFLETCSLRSPSASADHPAGASARSARHERSGRSSRRAGAAPDVARCCRRRWRR